MAERQREELGIPDAFFPFLEEEEQNGVQTGRFVFAQPAPDLSRDGKPEIIETDVRYRYVIDEGSQSLPSVESDVDTRIIVRSATSGRKLWAKRFDRDAFAFTMRVGAHARPGLVVITGLWNFFGTTESSTLRFDAFDGKTAKRLWSREYSSVGYYDLLTYVHTEAPIAISTFDGVGNRATDLLIGLATMVNALSTQTMTTRTVVVDGANGGQVPHPIVDVGVNWWPVPFATSDMDGDRRDDYALTNNIGFDPGDPDAQEGPSFGGTVYTRRGADGTPVWTTSNVEMELYGFTRGMPDVMGNGTPELALSTTVRRVVDAPVPGVPVSLPGGVRYVPRIYLFEGDYGSVVWRRQWDSINSPGDIDRNGKHDVVLTKFSMSFERNRTVFDQLAITGHARRLWRNRSVWRFEAMPCPRGACAGGGWMGLDLSPDFQPDGVRDVFLNQAVQQNVVVDDRVTRLYSGRTGRMTLEDTSDRQIQTTGVPIDGRGTDLVAFLHEDGKVRMTARNAHNRIIWGGVLGGPETLLPRDSGFWAMGFFLPSDRCGDLVVNGYENNDYFYGIFDGGSGRMIWSRWTGDRAARPRFTKINDRNRSC